MKILIYGSAHLTSETCKVLKDHYDLVGHIPSVNPVIAGDMELPIVTEDVDHDIKLSLQYNVKMQNIENAYNVHTGLLPLWGGQDILYHTIKEKAKRQGLTFHKMSKDFDYGNIISKITYPVLEGDDMIDLYSKMTAIFPGFVLSSLKLLENLGNENVNRCQKKRPRLFKRGNIDASDMNVYKETLPILRKLYEK